MTTRDLRPDPLAYIGEELDDLRNRHLYRPLRVMSSAQGPIVSVDDRRLISLSSNDYLGLTHHPRLRDAALQAVRDFGAGDLLEVEPPAGESWWLPFTREAVPEVQMAAGRIVAVRPDEVE